MERVIYDIALDLSGGHTAGAVTVKRGDTHRTLRIHLTDGGRPYCPGVGCTAVFTAVKPDGTHLYNACRVEDEAIVYDLTPQTTGIPGELECEVRLYGADEALLTSAAFTMTVADTVYADGDESIASTGEATVLTQLLSKATIKIAQMDAVLANEVNHAVIDDSALGADAWSSKNIADKLCPAFTAAGGVAACDPVEGYPLEVISTINRKDDASGWNAITLTQCGKNLFDFKKGVGDIVFRSPSGTNTYKHGYAIALPAGTYTAHAEPVGTADRDQYIYCYANDASGNFIDLTTYLKNADGIPHLRQGKGTTCKNRVFEFDIDVVLYVYLGGATSLSSAQNVLVNGNNIQLEVGSVATDYEPYRGQTFTADLSGTEYPCNYGSYNWRTGILSNGENGYWQHDPETNTFTEIESLSTYLPTVVRNIPALAGTNRLYSDCGNTEVKGKADPVAIIKKQEERLAALEAAMVSDAQE